ncbi:MAG: LUD domain-containing protein [Hyphomicrobiaceae bacterium]
MSTREEILGKVRKSLGVGGGDAQAEAERRATARARIAAPARHPLPGRVAGKSAVELLGVLRAQLEASAVTVVDAASNDEVPDAISRYLRAQNLPQRVRLGSDPMLATLPWTRSPTLEAVHGRAELSDEVGVSSPVAGVAETGTLILASGPDNPVTLNFVPETHVVVLPADRVVAGYEDAFARVRQKFGAGTMPRTINMISGPSRTGDIGGRIVMGAHGPRRMCVVLVGAPDR